MFVRRNTLRSRNDGIPIDVAAECEQNNKACHQNGIAIQRQTGLLPTSLPSLLRSVKRRRLFIKGKLTQQQWLATLLSASVHCSRGYDIGALLRDRPALADAAIHRVDSDDRRFFETHTLPRNCQNI